MIYEKFNAYIKEKYFANIDSHTHVVLSVDKQVIEKFYRENSISDRQLKEEFRRLFSESWNRALMTDNFFGLIAIQIYIAHLMHEKHENGRNISASNYNDILCEYLGVSISVIQRLYRDYQVKLWHMLKDWTIQNLFMLSLPEKCDGPWSKVKYPLSQALLNQDDLNRLPVLFVKNEIKPINRSGFYEFSAAIKELDCKHKDILTAHYFRVKERLSQHRDRELLDLLYRQIFEYYRNWDGEIPEIELKQYSRSLNPQVLLSSSRILTYNEPYFQILDFRYNLIEKVEIDTRELFQRIKKHYLLSHPDFIFFIKDDYEEWVEKKYLEAGSKNLIILKRDLPEEFLFKRIDSKHELTIFNYFVIIEIEIPKDYEPADWLKRYLKDRNRPFSIENGLKLDLKTWMHHAGPDIKFEKMIEVWIINSEANNNIEKLDMTKEMTISLRDYFPGKYVLVFPDYGRITIEIKSPTSNNDSDCKMGWVVAKKPAKWYPVQDQYQISGLINTFTTDKFSESGIRDWIDSSLGKGEKEQNLNNPLITNAIKRTKHGIRL